MRRDAVGDEANAVRVKHDDDDDDDDMCVFVVSLILVFSSLEAPLKSGGGIAGTRR